MGNDGIYSFLWVMQGLHHKTVVSVLINSPAPGLLPLVQAAFGKILHRLGFRV